MAPRNVPFFVFSLFFVRAMTSPRKKFFFLVITSTFFVSFDGRGGPPKGHEIFHAFCPATPQNWTRHKNPEEQFLTYHRRSDMEPSVLFLEAKRFFSSPCQSCKTELPRKKVENVHCLYLSLQRLISEWPKWIDQQIGRTC